MKYRSTVVGLVWLAFLVCPGWASSESCESMTRQLGQLRVDYDRYATGLEAQAVAITFEELAARLDKIVKLKGEMRKAECKVPARSRTWSGKNKDDTDRSIRPSRTGLKSKRN
jgi:hypothetical protein